MEFESAEIFNGRFQSTSLVGCLIALTMTSALTAQCLAGSITTMSDESTREVLQREHQYTAALPHSDTELLTSVLADSFVDTNEGGALRDKQQLLQIIAHQSPPAAIVETARKIQIMAIRQW